MSPDVSASVYFSALKQSAISLRPRSLARVPLERHAASLIDFPFLQSPN